MNDIPAPDDPEPSPKRARGLFGFARRVKKEGDQPPKALGPGPKAMRLRLAEFEDARVDDVMIPRAEIVAVEVDTSFDDLITLFADVKHSRLPVYRETLDNPVGFVHIKDVVGEIARGASKQGDILRRIARNSLIVPPSMPLAALLVKMQATRIHLAIVVDEYGGTDGLVTIEDLIEPIVGDIDDEHDAAEPEVQTLTDTGGRSVWEADARITIEDFEAALGRDFATDDEEEDVDTLGGLIFTLAGRVPERGEIIRHETGLEFEVLDADPRRVKRLRIRDARSKTEPKPEKITTSPIAENST